jgi:G3E family GTPase
VDAVIPVTVITGFLGAGKSTLLERWLGELPRDETAVIINERGAVGIDGELLANRADRLREITGGCVCCTSQAALAAALQDYAESTPAPARILIETSGAASPAGVIRALTRGDARDRLRLDGVVTVIDASRAERAMKYGLTIEQLGFADVVVMSHAELSTEADLDVLQDSLAPYAPGAVVARTSMGQLVSDGAQTLLELLAARGDVLRVAPSGARSSSTHGIDAVSLVHDGELDERRFGDWVEDVLGPIEARLLRIKGILAVAGVDERVIVQGVGEAIEVTVGAPWTDAPRTSRLVILGIDLDEGTLRTGFTSCGTEPKPQTDDR